MEISSAAPTTDPLATRNGPLTCILMAGEEPVTLPTEIWILILRMVVDPDRFCYDYCTSFDFPRFNGEFSMLFASKSNMVDINKQISQLRMVCRLWSILLEPTWKPYLKTQTPFDSIGAYKGIHTLYVEENHKSNHNEHPPHSFDHSVVEATRNTNTLIIHDCAWTKGQGFTNTFLAGPGQFSNVRSFFYLNKHAFPSDFWMRLEQALPRLIALTVAGLGQEGGTITLPNLEIFDLDIAVPSPPYFNFPRLKHFSSDGGPDTLCCVQIIRSYGRNIESLLFPYYESDDVGFFGGDFWTKLPKLQLIGAWASTLSKLPPPPVGHPFYHLCLYEYDLQSTQSLVSKLQGLRYLSVVCINESQRAEQDQAVLVDQFLTRNGAMRLEIRIYSERSTPELDRLMEGGSWQKVGYHPSFCIDSILCTWEFKPNESDFS